MYNKILEPLLENEPEKVITDAGVWMRQKGYPLFCHVSRRKTKRAFVLVSQERIPEDEPVIFVSAHEFREDVEATYLVAGRAAYVVNGSVSTVMNSFLGIENWAVGAVYSKVGYPYDLSEMNQTDAMELVRERLSTLKWELMKQYAVRRREDFPSGRALDMYWEKYTRYINKNECTPEDAFAFMKELVPSQKNAFLFRGNL